MAREYRPIKLAVSAGEHVFDLKDPCACADWIAQNKFQRLICHRGTFHDYNGRFYQVIPDVDVRDKIYRSLRGVLTPQGKPVLPHRRAVSDIEDALRSAVHLASAVSEPAWLDEYDGPPAGEYISMRNGLLHLPTRELIPHSAALFGTNGVDFDFIGEAGAPKLWLEFLSQIWPNDQPSIDALQEWCGYFLTADTRMQKGLMLIGPRRSGKGTIGRILRAVVGPHNVANPTLASLAGLFGLESLIGRRLAIISDARLSTRTDQAIVVERLLSIIGEDALTIDRKFKTAWSGAFPLRFMLLSNELPKFIDAGGALSSRFVVLQIVESFLGREDETLTDRLLTEAPAIFGWALDGLDRLRRRRHFLQPAGGQATADALADLVSPVAAFVRDCCIVGAEGDCDCDAVYRAWRGWAHAKGWHKVGTAQTFGRDLRAAVSGLQVTQPRVEGDRVRRYVAFALNDYGKDLARDGTHGTRTSQCESIADGER